MIPDPFEPPPNRAPPVPPLFWCLDSWAMVDQLDARGLATVTMVVRQRRDTETMILAIRVNPRQSRVVPVVEADVTSTLLQRQPIGVENVPVTMLDLATAIVRQHREALLSGWHAP